MGTELSVPTDMITPTKAFSLLTAYQILAVDGVRRGIWGIVAIISIMYAPMHLHTHVVHDCSELFFVYCGANFNC